MLEMAAIGYDGAHMAENVLSDLRSKRTDAWLSEISIIEHDADGRYSVKAKNPKVGEGHIGSGAALGGLTGVFVGLIGGPLGLLFWGAIGAITGGSIGASKESAFKPLVDELEDRLPTDASMLLLVGETQAIDDLITATGAAGDQLLRRPLNSEQAKELREAAPSAS
jgi:uncharacterized membrane protein